MEKKKRGWLMGMFMAGGIVMGAFMNVFDNVISGRPGTTIARLENEKRNYGIAQHSGDDEGDDKDGDDNGNEAPTS